MTYFFMLLISIGLSCAFYNLGRAKGIKETNHIWANVFKEERLKFKQELEKCNHA